jgi:hypothetical protein
VHVVQRDPGVGLGERRAGVRERGHRLGRAVRVEPAVLDRDEQGLR